MVIQSKYETSAPRHSFDDMRTLPASRDPLDADAVALLVDRIGRESGSPAASSAGISEHDGEIRRRVCEQAAWLVIEPDEAANAAGAARITAPAAKSRPGSFRPTRI